MQVELWDLVEGIEAAPVSGDDSGVQQRYQKRQRRAYVLLANMVADSQISHIMDCKTASEAWKKLEKLYYSKSIANRLLMKAQFDSLKKGDSESMQDWFGRVHTAAERVKGTGSTCSEEDVLLKILGGLPEQLRPLQMVLEAIPKLTLDEAKARLLHEELRRPIGAATDSALLGHHGNKGGSSGGNLGGNKHPSSKKITCHYCGKVGHKAFKCFKKKRDMQKNQNDSASKTATANTASENVFVAGGISVNAEQWYLDSGATKHMTRVKSWFSDFKDCSPCPVFIGNGTALKCVGTGSIACAMLVNDAPISGKLSDVWYVPELTTNLLSVSCLTSKGWAVDFGEQECIIKSAAGAVVAKAVKEDNMYRVLMTAARTSAAAHVAATSQAAQLWHERLGHVGAASLGLLQQKEMVAGIPKLAGSVDKPCVTCLEGKQERGPFPKKSFTRASEVLGLVHSDIWGPASVASYGGALYFIIFVDDLSRHTSVYFMSTRDQALSKFKEYKSWAEKQTRKLLKKFRSDGAGEYTSQAFDAFLKQCGIERQLPPARTPEQNGVAERCIKTVTEMMRCMLVGRKLNRALWAEAVATAVYTKNRLPTKAVPDKTPEEVWTGKKPSVLHMRVFGCIAHVLVPSMKRSKLDAKSVECMFVG